MPDIILSNTASFGRISTIGIGGAGAPAGGTAGGLQLVLACAVSTDQPI